MTCFLFIRTKRQVYFWLYNFEMPYVWVTLMRTVFLLATKIWIWTFQMSRVHFWLKDISTQTFQPQASTPDLSTPDFLTMNFSTPDFSTMNFWTTGLKSSWFKSLGLKRLGLKCHLSRRLKDISTPDFSTTDFSTINFSTPWFKNLWLKSLGLKSSWLKSLGLKGPGLTLGVEKSGVEMSFNHFSYLTDLGDVNFEHLDFTSESHVLFTSSFQIHVGLIHSWGQFHDLLLLSLEIRR